ncbi:MAG: hypothetical protein BGN88_09895 [Clostridiales bacterium 43-6]|nr:MAG: hypothetical protein BGN88_09895 [Clostridiales bacterium 43-6]
MNIKKYEVYKMMANILNVEINQISKINYDDDFANYGMTSILAIKLVVMLEEKYNFEFHDSDLLFDKFNTFNKLFALLESY